MNELCYTTHAKKAESDSVIHYTGSLDKDLRNKQRCMSNSCIGHLFQVKYSEYWIWSLRIKIQSKLHNPEILRIITRIIITCLCLICLTRQVTVLILIEHK